MKPPQERVLIERAELAEKISRLAKFMLLDMFGALPPKEQERMKRQLLIMKQYLDVLDERIAAFD